MAPLVLALLTLGGALAEPVPQQASDDYQAQVRQWQGTVVQMVALVDEIVRDETLWQTLAVTTRSRPSLPSSDPRWRNLNDNQLWPDANDVHCGVTNAR